MFTRSHFRIHPYLRFHMAPGDGSGTPGAAPEAGGEPQGGDNGGQPTGIPAEQPQPGTDLGFPAETKVADMTAEQQAAYWKHHARRHEANATALQARQQDYDTYKSDSAELQRIRDEALTPEQRQQKQQERTAAQTNGLLVDAVSGRLQALTGKSEADINQQLEFLDLSKFTGQDGRIDAAKVQTFADSIGKKAAPAPTPTPTPGVDPIAAALGGLGDPAGQPRQGGSIKEQQAQIVSALTPKK